MTAASSTSHSGDSAGDGGLYRPFRPRRARAMAWTIAVGEIVVLTGLAVALPGPNVHWYDRLGFLLVAAAVAATLSRFARLLAVPDRDGLRVRNVVYTRRLDWAQIVRVQFGGGNPWAVLDLSDGETLAVMAVQRADGERAVAEARRLATLVALHTRTSRDD
jgi:Bacterial PH domain